MIVRADASLHIGAGHLMRCLALAQAWQARGGTATFLSHGDNAALRDRVESTGITWVRVAEPHPAASDLQTTLSILGRRAGHSAPWLVLDGYHFDSAYQAAIRAEGHRLMVVDDTAHLPSYHADCLLNQNIQADRSSYTCEPDTVCLLGTRYALLRPEFLVRRIRERPMPDVASRVLVTLGGSDPNNVTLKVIQALEIANLPQMEARIVIGPANPHLEELRCAAWSSTQNLQLLTAVTDMPGLMGWADVAIAAGGSTCWELALMGVPTLAIVLAENQRELAETLAELKAAIDLGDAGQLNTSGFADSLTSLSKDRGSRSRLAKSSRALVDGRGAQRVAALLEQGRQNRAGSCLTLREAEPQDAFQIWRWANDPTTRANSFHREPIHWAEHLEWYEAKQASPGSRMWVLEDRGVPVGHIRCDCAEPDIARISFVVDTDHRGRGLGTRMLQLSAPQCFSLLGVKRVQGITFKSNVASARAFMRAGFRQVTEERISNVDCVTFERGCISAA